METKYATKKLKISLQLSPSLISHRFSFKRFLQVLVVCSDHSKEDFLNRQPLGLQEVNFQLMNSNKSHQYSLKGFPNMSSIMVQFVVDHIHRFLFEAVFNFPSHSCIYIDDDIILLENDTKTIQHLINRLGDEFKIMDLEKHTLLPKPNMPNISLKNQ